MYDYAKLKDIEDLEQHNAVLQEVATTIGSLRFSLLIIFLSFLTAALTLSLVMYNFSLPEEEDRSYFQNVCLMASIPIVALLFTWFHIWLAIQMMFRPLKFFGIWQYKGRDGPTGLGIGWQGVVPRKALKMAKTAFACARPFLSPPHDWFSSVDARYMIRQIRPMLTPLVRSTLEKVGLDHFPEVFKRITPTILDELTLSAVDKVEETAQDMWDKISIILEHKETGIDNDSMVVSVFANNKALLNRFFFQVGKREFRFIEGCGAFLGFVCGLLQLVAFNNFNVNSRQIMLPSTGFFLGILTNWLAIQMCFFPVFPHRVMNGKLNIQGLFMRRQAEVSEVYSKMLTDNFFKFHKVLDYLFTRDELWEKLKDVYLKHNTYVFEETLGPTMVALTASPLVLGSDRYKKLQDDVKLEMVDKMAKAYKIHDVIGKYVAYATDIHRKNTKAMREMPPDKFENLLHPVFQEDEWILILLGGVLGAIVGIGQVYILKDI